MKKLKSMWVKVLHFIFRYQFVEVGDFVWEYWGWTNTIVCYTPYRILKVKPNEKTRQAILNGELENVAKVLLSDMERLAGLSLNIVFDDGEYEDWSEE